LSEFNTPGLEQTLGQFSQVIRQDWRSRWNHRRMCSNRLTLAVYFITQLQRGAAWIG
jgi:hypothetical protein